MRRTTRRWLVGGALALGALLALAGAGWLGLRYEPGFYRRTLADRPGPERRAEADRFVRIGARLRNDIANEPRWEAVFDDEEVNAWLAEDLLTYFADQLPEGVRDPRVAFETDRVTLAFRLENGPLSTIVWVVARVRVRDENLLALTVEKIRAGVVPIPAGRFLGPIAAHGRHHGLDIDWDWEDGEPVALIRYEPDAERSDVVLERLLIRDGRIELAGRSRQARPAAHLKLPSRRVLQVTFPRRKHHGRSGEPIWIRRSSASPAS